MGMLCFQLLIFRKIFEILRVSHYCWGGCAIWVGKTIRGNRGGTHTFAGQIFIQRQKVIGRKINVEN